MNTRFSYNLLQVFTKKRPAGFALPLVVMTGTVLLVVGAAMLVKGTNDQNQVVSQKAKMVANNAAEAGMTQLQAFLLRNPVLAKVPMSAWGTVDGNGNFVPDSTLISTAAAELRSTSCNYAGMTPAAVQTALSNEMTTLYQQAMANPENLPNPSGNAGMAPSFQIVDYRYDGNNATAHIRGESANGAESHLVASFPVTGGNVTQPTSIFPGLWVKEYLQPGQNDNNPGTLDAEIAYDCSINAGTFTQSNITVNPGGYQYVKYVSSNDAANNEAAVRVALPVGTAAPTVTERPMPDPESAADAPVTPISLGNVTSSLVLPRTDDNTTSGTINDSSNYDSASDTYYYTLSSLSYTGSDKLQFIPGEKVVVYLTGNISIGGTSEIIHDCDGVSPCDATDVRILGSTSNSSGTFATSGNSAVCSIFFWAPTYTTDMNGGGNAGNCSSGANQNGIYWVKAWTGGGQGSHSALQQTGSNWNNIMSVVSFPVKNQLGANSTWSMVDGNGASTLMANISLPSPTPTPSPIDGEGGAQNPVDEVVEEVVEETPVEGVVDEVPTEVANTCVKGFFTSGSKKGQCKD